MEEKNLVPYKKNDVEKLESKELLKRIEGLLKHLNKAPDKSMILRHNDGFSYLPISHIETLLDEWFFGQWELSDFHYEQVCNEIIGDITLTVTHPITGKPIRRIGAASVAIMQNKGSTLEDFTKTKKKTALVMGFPKLKAECFKNAVLSLGKSFGRDLNRKVFDSYEPLIGSESDTEGLISEVIKKLNDYEGDNKQELKDMCMAKKKNGEFTEEFAQNILSQIEGN